MHRVLFVVLECADALVPRVRYVFDTLFMAAGISVVYVSEPPPDGPWLLYGDSKAANWPLERCCSVLYAPEAWLAIEAGACLQGIHHCDGSCVMFLGGTGAQGAAEEVRFDLPANAFYFLASCSERNATGPAGNRVLYASSVFNRLGVPQDIVDRYLLTLVERLRDLCQRLEMASWRRPNWPSQRSFAVVLSHDVDFLPRSGIDTARQGAKTFFRHLVRERAPGEAFRAMSGLARAVIGGRDAYGCIPEIIAREKALGVRASFQVAVARRHPLDVNYDVEDDATAEYLRSIPRAGFDVCLHGSYRSSEDPGWYREEVVRLERRLCRPRGSRQHYLSFDYDALFSAQETAEIEFDMSMGYPDRTGPRAGFSYPYFPYCMTEERPYDVLQISLLIMDVTLRSYMNFKAAPAWNEIERQLRGLAQKGGCGSVVWHPIVFGGARDPGYDELFWRMVRTIQDMGGLATDGAEVSDYWRSRAGSYWSFSGHGKPHRLVGHATGGSSV